MKKKKANVLHIVREDVSLVEMLQPGKASALPGGEILAQPEAKQVVVAEPDADEAPVDFAPDGYLELDDQEAENGSSQSPDPFKSEDSPMKAWAEAVQLVRELNPAEERIQAWWKAAYNLEVSKADFKKQRAPDKLGGAMIVCFRDKLMETKAYQKQTALPW
jgi:hypothetical protein